MPKAYPRDFRDDVVAVAQRREDGVMTKSIAKDLVVLRGLPARLAALGWDEVW